MINWKKLRQGFTLIEMLVVVILVVIIIMSIAVVFGSTSETTRQGESREKVYANARISLSKLEEDLMGCVPFNGGQQFVMRNGLSQASGAITYDVGGGHYDKAADMLVFRSVVSVGPALYLSEVSYHLQQEPSSEMKTTVRTNRPLYVLIRRIRGSGTSLPTPDAPDSSYTCPVGGCAFNKAQQFINPITGSGAIKVSDQDLCHYILQFNLEYLSDKGLFSQLDPSPFPVSDPLGNGTGPNDTTTPYRVPAVRATIVVTDGPEEFTERMFSRNIWLPMG